MRAVRLKRDATRRLSLKLALLALGCVFALVLGEVAVRVLALAPAANAVFRENYRLSDDPKLQYELVPGSRDGKQRINASGQRDVDYPQAKPPGVFRIAVVGDSIAYGFGVPQRDALAKQLEDLLRGYHSPNLTRFEVLNFGVSGYNIEQVLQAARTRALAFAPDLILYAYCLNDPQGFSFEYESLRAQLSPAQRSYRDAILEQGRRALLHSRLYLLARYALQSAAAQPTTEHVLDTQWAALSTGSYPAYFEQLYRGADLARLEASLTGFAQLAQQQHVPVVALVFPVFADLGNYRLAAVHARVRERFAAAGIPSYDLSSVYTAMFQKHGRLFIYNALHPNGLGHRLAALYALHALIDDKRLPPAAEPWTAPSELAELDRVLEPIVAAARSSMH